MILDTTYLLPLAGIGVDVDLLRSIVEGRVPLDLGDVKVSLISLFELQAKAAKLDIPVERVVKASLYPVLHLPYQPLYST